MKAMKAMKSGKQRKLHKAFPGAVRLCRRVRAMKAIDDYKVVFENRLFVSNSKHVFLVCKLNS